MGSDAGPETRLLEITARDFAIIDALSIEWSPRLNVLTGETGAGKSIVIEAIGAALGDRAEASWIRSGAGRASVEAVFCVSSTADDLRSLLTHLGCSADDDQLVLARDLTAGRSISRVNARAVPLSAVQEVAEQLVDIHSQASHLSLLRRQEQLEALDRYAGLGEPRTDMARAARALRTLRTEIARLEEDKRRAAREEALLRHEVDEIDAAALAEGEEDELSARRARLKHAVRLRQLGTAVRDALRGSDDGRGALDLLQEAAARLHEIRALDSALPLTDDRLAEAVDTAEELARAMRGYLDSIEDDPAALDAVEERLLAIGDLKRKYGATLREVLAYRDEAARRLEAIEHYDERAEELRVDESRQLQVAEATARALSIARADTAAGLAEAVERELAALGLEGARFVAELSRRPDEDGLSLDGERVAFDETGADQVEFLIAPNPGELPRPLARIASGGELARFALALKSVLSSVDRTPILVFDELDQGVGGRTGHVVGEKLWRLARNHQVLCITHLAQIAAYADAHYAASKVVEHGRTVTRIKLLGPDERLEELAAMLGGTKAGPAARQSAKELLARAAEWKRGPGGLQGAS